MVEWVPLVAVLMRIIDNKHHRDNTTDSMKAYDHHGHPIKSRTEASDSSRAIKINTKCKLKYKLMSQTSPPHLI